MEFIKNKDREMERVNCGMKKLPVRSKFNYHLFLDAQNGLKSIMGTASEIHKKLFDLEQQITEKVPVGLTSWPALQLSIWLSQIRN